MLIQIWILITLSRLILHQTKFCLMLNQSEKCNYDPNLVWYKKFKKIFLKNIKKPYGLLMGLLHYKPCFNEVSIFLFIFLSLWLCSERWPADLSTGEAINRGLCQLSSSKTTRLPYSTTASLPYSTSPSGVVSISYAYYK